MPVTDKFSEQVLMVIIALGAAGFLAWLDRVRREMGWRPDAEWLFIAVLLLTSAVLLPVVDISSGLLRFADLPFSDEFAWMGLVKGVLAIWLLWRALVDYHPPAPQSAEPMAVGIYCYIRHPVYTALLVFTFAQALLAQNWLAGVLALLAFVVIYGLRVPRDEEQGLEQYGHRYLDYMTRTGALLPRFTRPGRRH